MKNIDIHIDFFNAEKKPLRYFCADANNLFGHSLCDMNDVLYSLDNTVLL